MKNLLHQERAKKVKNVTMDNPQEMNTLFLLKVLEVPQRLYVTQLKKSNF
jgi:hypothetical protein